MRSETIEKRKKIQTQHRSVRQLYGRAEKRNNIQALLGEEVQQRRLHSMKAGNYYVVYLKCK